MGGMVLETNMNEIVAQIEAQNRLEKSEVSAPAGAVREPRGGRRNGCTCWFVLLWNFGNVRTSLLSSLSPSKPACGKASPED